MPEMPKNLLRVYHANGRIWFQIPKEAMSTNNPLNSVDFDPAIAHRIKYAVRDHRGEFLYRLQRTFEEAKGFLKIEVPGMARTEQTVELEPRMTQALLEVVRDYPSAFIRQLDYCTGLARMSIASGHEMPNLSNVPKT